MPGFSSTPPAPVAVAPVGPADPVAAFAAGATPGVPGTVSLSDGRRVQARLVRAYSAASGRDCREVALGAGLDERATLYCQADGRWVATRPLLRGAAGTLAP